MGRDGIMASTIFPLPLPRRDLTHAGLRLRANPHLLGLQPPCFLLPDLCPRRVLRLQQIDRQALGDRQA